MTGSQSMAQVMKVHWHNRQAVFTTDMASLQDYSNGNSSSQVRMATGGGDGKVCIWRFSESELAPVFCQSLSKHERPVNCVRFSPNQQVLASGSDGGQVVLWQFAHRNDELMAVEGEQQHKPLVFGETNSDEEEEDLNEDVFHWTLLKQFRCCGDGSEDIYDMAWSPDSHLLMLALTDNSVQIWDTIHLRCIKLIKEHSHFVQGVAWDPFDRFLASVSCDQSARIWRRMYGDAMTKKDRALMSKTGVGMTLALHSRIARVERSISSSLMQIDSNNTAEAMSQHVDSTVHLQSQFEGEGLVSFFRRPDWSPDGSLLFLPAVRLATITGNSTDSSGSSSRRSKSNGFYVIPRNSLCNSSAVAVMHGFNRSVIGIRSHPRLFHRRRTEAVIDLPYRLVWAVYSVDSVAIYDSECNRPLLMVRDLHYGTITDVSWSPCNRFLVIAASDGFCSMVRFDQSDSCDLLGDVLSADEEQMYLEKVAEILRISERESMDSVLSMADLNMHSSVADEATADHTIVLSNNSDTVRDDTDSSTGNTTLISDTVDPAKETIIKRRIQPTLISGL